MTLAYDTDGTRNATKGLKAKACIKPNKYRTTRKRYDKTLYKVRNQIERFFDHIKHCRCVGTRCENTIQTLTASSGSLH